ncbi:MAG: RdgB/HAM1 family non-canonical purine NTP pyrophosphatase [Phycisphaerales bacterium]|nr:MAG: RdgB/HAM1 family non-canonical purine NTP pyrophosphatase [Phycisphaerales bacterium]
MVGRRAILVATSNPNKLREILDVIGDLPAEWSTLGDHPPMPEPVEDGDTFEANASKKALHYATHCGTWVLADDSGLEVDVLGLAPGVHSARYAGDAQDAAANNAKLVAALAGVPVHRRTARFRCAIAVADEERIMISASGTIEGVIIDEPRGKNGFGYDPHFEVLDYGMTTAEMEPARKNAISHRGRALAELRPKLAALLASDG